MKADRTVKRELRRLRHYINANPGTLEARIAYEVECAIRWAREDGIRGWPSPLDLATSGARILRNDLSSGDTK
jgi:hypothetical protein